MEQNFYWSKVFSKSAYQRDYERSLARLDFTQTPGCDLASIAHAMAGRSYLLDCMREVLFESVRAEFAPAAPSRRDCLFLIDEGADVERCAERYGFARGERTVVRIEALEGSRVFRGQASALDTSPIVGEIVAAARRYWLGARSDAPDCDVEILLTGPFCISGVRHEGTAPSVCIDGKGLAELFGE